jgi:flagellar biosynthesis protein FlhG
MSDQAAGLRALRANGARPGRPIDPAAGVIAVGSGKGGAGKSVVSVWLAAALARAGRRVLLFDGGLTHGNLHLLLGHAPDRSLERFHAGEGTLESLPVPVAERLWLLPAAPASETLHTLGPVECARLHFRLTALYERFDAVVVDTGHGLESVVRAATLRAGRLVLVTLPEPAALADAYAVLKRVHEQVPTLPVDVLVNRTEGEEEGSSAFEILRAAADRFLGRPLGSLGSLAEQPGMRARVRTPGALLDDVPAPLAGLAATLVAEGATR